MKLPLIDHPLRDSFRLNDSDGNFVGEFSNESSANFAKLAINNHYQLLEALKKAKNQLENLNEGADLVKLPRTDSPLNTAFQEILKAIAEAEK